MPSPIVHTGVGLALAWAVQRRDALPGERPLPWALFAVAISSAPDLDYLPGLAIGQLNAFHQGPTHSLAAALLFAGAVTLCRPLRRAVAPQATARRFFAVSLLLLLAHLALDIFTQDFRPPIGIPLFWPLPFPHLHAGGPFLFPAWAKLKLADLFTAVNLRPALVETACAAVALLLAALVPRKKAARDQSNRAGFEIP